MKPVQHCLQKIIFDPIRESSPLLSNAEATAFAKQFRGMQQPRLQQSPPLDGGWTAWLQVSAAFALYWNSL